MSVIVKNESGASKIYGGVTIADQASYTIQQADRYLFQSDDVLIADIGSGDAVINDGTNDLSISDGMAHLMGYYQKFGETPGGTKLVAIKKADGSSFTKVTHDFTDKTTWYQESVQVTDEVLSGSGVGPYTSANPNWIDVINGKIYQQHLHQQYVVEVKVDDVVQSSGYTIDHASGAVTFDSSQSGVIKASYYHQNGSTWTLEPDAGKAIRLEHSEIQFTKDCTVSTPVAFEVWVYNPLVDLQSPIDPDDKTFIPGVSSGNPLRFLYKYEKYHNIKDIINTANLGQGFIPALSGLTNDVLVFPFNYVTEIQLLSSQGAQLRITLDSNTAFSGEWATATFYCGSEDE